MIGAASPGKPTGFPGERAYLDLIKTGFDWALPPPAMMMMNAIIINYATIQGVFCSFLWEDLLLILGAIGFIGLILTVLLAVRKFGGAVEDAQI